MKTIRHIALLAISVLLLASCEKMGENDQVSGFWQLVSVQNGSTTTDVTADQIFWGLQNGIISIKSFNNIVAKSETDEICTELVGSYNIRNNVLQLEPLFFHFDSYDIPIKVTEGTELLGIYSLNPNFTFYRKGNYLTLQFEDRTLTLLRF